MTNDNRREYYRHKLDPAIKCKMQIAKVGGKKLESKYADILLYDIGGIGLNFHTSLDLPVSQNLLLNFTITLLDRSISIHGVIAWKKKTDKETTPDGYDYSYGVQFIFMSDKEKEDLRTAINLYVAYEKRQREKAQR